MKTIRFYLYLSKAEIFTQLNRRTWQLSLKKMVYIHLCVKYANQHLSTQTQQFKTKKCKICLKLTIKILEASQLISLSFFIFNFEEKSCFVSIFLFLTFWTGEYTLRILYCSWKTACFFLGNSNSEEFLNKGFSKKLLKYLC